MLFCSMEISTWCSTSRIPQLTSTSPHASAIPFASKSQKAVGSVALEAVRPSLSITSNFLIPSIGTKSGKVIILSNGDPTEDVIDS